MSTHEATSRAARGPTSARPYQIRGRFLTAIALRLEGPADATLLSELDAQLRQTPQFFADAPMVIDLEPVGGRVGGDDLMRLVEHLRYRRISVFAVQGASRDQAEAAATLGLIVLPSGRDTARREPDPEVAAPAATPGAEAPKPANRLITTPVRSGQTVVAERGDLTVVGPVSSGAELIAAGHIHVYGPLRGRAFAGAFGDESARIFCQSLDAELLSIAGLYGTSETLEPVTRARNAQVFLRGDRLCIEPFGESPNRDRSPS